MKRPCRCEASRRAWREHVKSNRNVRAALNNNGIFPERLAAAEDIRKVERRIKSEEKRLMSGAQKLIKPDEPDPTP